MREGREHGSVVGVKTLLIVVYAVLFFIMNGTVFATLTATANKDHIDIDFFYHGNRVSMPIVQYSLLDDYMKCCILQRRDSFCS